MVYLNRSYPALLLTALAVCSVSARAGETLCGPCSSWSCQEATTIRQLQAALQGHGEEVKVDGSYGENTHRALKNFAEKNGISDVTPKNDSLIRKLFDSDLYNSINRRIKSAWVC